ncbi:IclR family transcriptional regulator [Acrocarpospora pleiomorpha]|uniref:IclR family transcriptional regulator n=1 Tax=Acrocarpospora pleiomorpha TaxID=90975 RepID=A0A5M3XA08_9ACTN|nr:IclR family transcriptional regulator C-terminal domain-containing protein [Acrocarpospora pleiomorpha]GES17572.1 IclR family transcriptional regulator [Acrocarpospora pleiomorpha]
MSEVAEGPYVHALERGLAVLRCFHDDRDQLTISDVAREAGMDRAVARRFLHTLVALGYLGTVNSRFYVRPRVLELARPYLDSVTNVDVIQPHLEQLTKEVGETSMAFVLDGHEIVFVAGVQAKRLVSVHVVLGTRVPAYCSPPGRVLLGSLSPDQLDDYFRHVELVQRTPHTVTSENALREEIKKVAEQGYSLVDQELESQLRTVAVPIRDRGGKIVAAASIGTTLDVAMEHLGGELLSKLTTAATEMERDLALIR